jgi:hypothetical protein
LSVCYSVCQALNHAHAFVNDPFGNYLLQQIIDLPFANALFAPAAHAQLRRHYAMLAHQQFASHVVEKFLKTTAVPADVRDEVVEELWLSCGIDGGSGAASVFGVDPAAAPELLASVLQDAHGNHVMQIAFEVGSRLRQQVGRALQLQRIALGHQQFSHFHHIHVVALFH